MQAQQELEILLRARYSLLQIVSWEEERVEQCVSAAAQAVGKKLCCWSSVRGLHVPSQVERKAVPSSDPLVALREVMQERQPVVYLFKDLSAFWSERLVVRQLREAAFALKSSPKTLILLNTTANMPPELEKETTLVDFPLPDCAALENLLDETQRDMGAHPLPPETRSHLAQASLGLTLREAENVLARSLIVQGKLSDESLPLMLAEKKQIIKKGGLLEYIDSVASLDSVGGLAGLKEWVRKRSLAFTPQASQFGLPAPRGLLLLGVQGCGKSLCAKALSAVWHMPILRLDVGRLFSGLMGSSEDNMRRAIAMSESIAPCILWVDEIEKAFAGSRGSESDGGTSSRILATFLTWLQEKQKCVFVIATANDITSLPPELLRKGRLDETFFVDLPTTQERVEIFNIHLRNRKRDPRFFKVQQLAEMCDGFSGSEIEQVIIAALYEAFDQQRDLTDTDIAKAISQTVPLSRTRREEISALREWAHSRARQAGG